jgi:hypothetical protein
VSDNGRAATAACIWGVPCGLDLANLLVRYTNWMCGCAHMWSQLGECVRLVCEASNVAVQQHACMMHDSTWEGSAP